jgi:S-(hydroxymethyl)glutathione dehydrogenase/alcohol dehydrogenase
MKTLAAILTELGKSLIVDEIEIPPLKPGQALVEIAYSGVCHTQILECDGHRGEDAYLPHCLGHEGSGTVKEIGSGVTKVKVDHKVVLSWMKGSGANVPGTVYRWNGVNVNAGGITTFSRYSIISENRLTVMPEGFSMQSAVLIGCAVATGLGSVFNTARPKPGQSMAVFGAGGIGLCAVAGAVAAGCTPVIAVDLQMSKLEAARDMGASHIIDASAVDPVSTINSLCKGGLDFAVESSGSTKAMEQSLKSVRSQGGVAVIIGNAKHGERLSLDPGQLNQGKQLRGTWGGDNDPDTDFPRYAKLVATGKIDVAKLISQEYQLSQINEALADLKKGKSLRPIIRMSSGQP